MGYRCRDRVRRILSHREADRVPYRAISSPQIRELVDRLDFRESHREFCLEGDFAAVTIEPAADVKVFNPYFDRLEDDVKLSCWGIGQRALTTQDGCHAGYQMFHPLERVDSLSGLKEFPFPDISRSGADEGLEEKVRALKDQGYTVIGQMSQTILETAYNMRSMPKLMMDFYERPEYVEYLFSAIAEQRRFQSRRFAEAGVDILRIGDDIASQTGLIVGPELYRERIKPFHSSVIKEARSLVPDLPVKYHSDGELTALLPDLLEIGVTIINPVQPECMDLREVKTRFGKDLTLWGCMPVQSVFAHGSQDDVLRHVDFLMEEISVDGGLVLTFTNFLATAKSLENMGVFFKAFYEKGGY